MYGLDALNKLAASQSFSTVAVTENALDLGAADKQLGISGLMIKFILHSLTSGLTSGVKIQVVDANVAALTTGLRVLCEVPLTAAEVATLIAAKEPVYVPIPARKLKQYLGGRVEPVSEAAVAFVVSAYVVTGAESKG